MRQWKISMVKSAMPFTLIQRITRTTVAAAAASASFTRDYRRWGCNHPSCGKKIPTNYHRRDQAEKHPLCIFNPQVAQESMIRKKPSLIRHNVEPVPFRENAVPNFRGGKFSKQRLIRGFAEQFLGTSQASHRCSSDPDSTRLQLIPSFLLPRDAGEDRRYRGMRIASSMEPRAK